MEVTGASLISIPSFCPLPKNGGVEIESKSQRRSPDKVSRRGSEEEFGISAACTRHNSPHHFRVVPLRLKLPTQACGRHKVAEPGATHVNDRAPSHGGACRGDYGPCSNVHLLHRLRPSEQWRWPFLHQLRRNLLPRPKVLHRLRPGQQRRVVLHRLRRLHGLDRRWSQKHRRRDHSCD